MKDYKIYCVYHDPKLIDEYNLKETDNFKLYFTKNEDEEKYNLNYVQLYLNEWVAQYYVWKNNLKSDIVGFCHYRRPLDKYLSIDDKLLNHIENSNYYSFEIGHYDKNNVMQSFYYGGLGLHIELLKEYINDKYDKFYLKRYNKLIYSKCYIQTFRELYLCKWDVFCNLTSFFNGYIKFLFNKILKLDIKELYEYTLDDYKNLDTYLNNENWNLRKQYIKDNNLKSPDYYFGSPRCTAFMIEFCTGVFFELFYSNKNF